MYPLAARKKTAFLFPEELFKTKELQDSDKNHHFLVFEIEWSVTLPKRSFSQNDYFPCKE